MVHVPTDFTDVHLRPDFQETIRVSVGRDTTAKTFTIHKSLATKHSDFFDTALRNDFEDTRKGHFIFEEDHVFVWTIFINWLYTGTIDVTEVDYMPNEKSTVSSTVSTIGLLLEAFRRLDLKYPQTETFYGGAG